MAWKQKDLVEEGLKVEDDLSTQYGHRELTFLDLNQLISLVSLKIISLLK